MRHMFGFGAFVLAASALAASSAQTPAAPVTTSQANIIDVQGTNCPVGLQASRSSGGGLLQVKPGEPRRGQQLFVAFLPTKVSDIVRADLTVHGTSGPHTMLAGQAPGAEVTENFTVSPAGEGHLRFTSTVYMKKITGITYVEVDALTYADGTRWQSSAISNCRAVPSGYKLVAGR